MILRFFKSPWLSVAGRLVLGATFIWSSIHKIKDPVAFALLVYDYDILPGKLVNPFAYSLPWVEFGSGVLIGPRCVFERGAPDYTGGRYSPEWFKEILEQGHEVI